jgi:hypothetical protein
MTPHRGWHPTASEWSAAREAMYAQGRTYAAGLVRNHGLVDASRGVIAATKAGDLCHDTARGALDTLLYYASEEGR